MAELSLSTSLFYKGDVDTDQVSPESPQGVVLNLRCFGVSRGQCPGTECRGEVFRPTERSCTAPGSELKVPC